jgi:hypothetical protein
MYNKYYILVSMLLKEQESDKEKAPSFLILGWFFGTDDRR